MYEEFVKLLREEFIENELQKKTSFGRNELVTIFDKSIIVAMVKIADSIPCLKPKTKGA